MVRRGLLECHTINKKAINEEVILNLFREYGNCITLCVVDQGHFEGIITYGNWKTNIAKENEWVNKECKYLIEDKKERTSSSFNLLGNRNEILYELAEEIFLANRDIRSIPIIDSYGFLQGVIDKYATQEALEKVFLEGIWGEFNEILSHDGYKNEIKYWKKALGREDYKVIIIGKNYLSEQIGQLLGLNFNNIYTLTDINWDGADYIIDMEVLYYRIRKDFLPNDKYKLVNTCYEFLNELKDKIMSQRLTLWHSAIDGPYCFLSDYFKRYKVKNVSISLKTLLRKEYIKYLESINYPFTFCEQYFHDMEMDVEQSGIVRRDTLEIILWYVTIENQIINMNLKWIEHIEEKVRILNFSMPLDMPLNKQEKKHFLNRDFDKCEEDDLIDFFNIDNVGYYGKEDLLNWIYMKKVWRKGRGMVYPDTALKDKTIVNSLRFTTDVPATYKNTIYIFGICIAQSILADDTRTIASKIQRMVNKNPTDYRVVNMGNPSPFSVSENFKNVDFKNGDIIINIFTNISEKSSQYIKFVDLGEAFGEYGEEHKTMFWDSTIHCNARANDIIADAIWPYLERLLIPTDENNNCIKEHSLYTVFNNDEDIEWAEDCVKEYINKLTSENIKLQQILNSRRSSKVVLDATSTIGKKNGAIVMNANPFTVGHQYLVEKASKEVEWLFVFVVQEDQSHFKFKERLDMVKTGIAHIPNVMALPSGDMMISARTFPGYFKKEQLNIDGGLTGIEKADAFTDVKIFGKYIAPILDIKVRYAGEEPKDEVTRAYNYLMSLVLPLYGVEFCEIKRYEIQIGMPVSASTVRRLLSKKDFVKLSRLVPESTLQYLNKNYGLPTLF